MKPKLFAAGLAGIVLAAGLAQAFEIASDQQIDGASPQIVGVGDGNTVTPSGAAPNWTYNWADRDGDGSSNAVAAAGLELGAFKLFAAVTDSSRGVLTLDLNGGDMVGSDGVAIITSPGVGSGRHSHHLTIRNVRDIAIGEILTYARGTSGAASGNVDAGNLTIGSEEVPARHVRIASIHTGDHTTGTRSSQRRGNIVVHATGNVLIEDAEGNPGTIRTHADAEPNIGGGYADPGHVAIAHDGDFRIKDFIGHMSTYSARKNPAVIVLDGGSQAGDCVIRDIDNRHYATGYGSTGRGLVDIRNYANVFIRNIDSSHPFTDNRMGGHVEITDIAGNIEIAGTIDCSSGHSDVERNYGHLKLTATGTITLAELNMDKVLFASFSSGSGRSMIEGELLNFDAAGSGAGTLLEPVVTTQTALRVPNGQRLLYKVRDDANAGLEGKVYRIANASGQAGQGGLLMPIPTRGTVLLFF